MTPIVTMRQALADPDVFGKVLVGESWNAWRALLIAAMGEALTDAERTIFTGLTGREREPLMRVDEFVAIKGRRGGGTRAAAVLASYLAGLCDFSDRLAPGERGLLPILSASVWQARKALQYIDGIFSTVPALKRLIVNQTEEMLSLSNGADIECRPANYRTIRSATLIGLVGDEIAWWRNEETSRNPDKEILDAARPGLATTDGPMILISSPYGKRGVLWETFRRDFGRGGDPLVLVAKAPSRVMNPLLPQKVVDRAYERDQVAARAEFDAEFRDDVIGFLTAELVDVAIDRGVIVRPPLPGVRYRSGCDPSGGARDSFTLAIAHDEADVAVLDCLVEIKPPFNPTAATAQMAEVLKSYRLTRTVGDRYAAEWVVDAFKKVGINYDHSERDRSAVYMDALPLFTSGRARLLDMPRLASQFSNLERRTAPGGRDRVDHGPSGHDDLCNAAALAIVTKGRAPMVITEELLARAAIPPPGRGGEGIAAGVPMERTAFHISRN